MSSEEDLHMKEAAERAKYLRSTLKSFTGRPEVGPLAVIKALLESTTARTLERMGQAPWTQQNQPQGQYQNPQQVQPQQVQPQQEQLPNNGGLFSNLRGFFQPPPPPPPLTEEEIAIQEEEARLFKAEQDRQMKKILDREKVKRLRNFSIDTGGD